MKDLHLRLMETKLLEYPVDRLENCSRHGRFNRLERADRQEERVGLDADSSRVPAAVNKDGSERCDRIVPIVVSDEVLNPGCPPESLLTQRPEHHDRIFVQR